jgi:hypothetical protein
MRIFSEIGKSNDGLVSLMPASQIRASSWVRKRLRVLDEYKVM